jgi:hypothetical protein
MSSKFGTDTVREVMVSDLNHFLELPADTPRPARRVADQVSDLVRAATAGDAGTAWETAVPCRRRPGNRVCPGRMIVLRSEQDVPIQWQCSVCEDSGMISNWRDSPFDLRRRVLRVAEAANDIAILNETAAAIRELQLLDTDCERLVFRIRTHENAALLIGTDDDLEALIAAAAAEANHEPNRRRQRRLDAAFDALNGAAAGGS